MTTATISTDELREKNWKIQVLIGAAQTSVWEIQTSLLLVKAAADYRNQGDKVDIATLVDNIEFFLDLWLRDFAPKVADLKQILDEAHDLSGELGRQLNQIAERP